MSGGICAGSSGEALRRAMRRVGLSLNLLSCLRFFSFDSMEIYIPR
jgi:hypothetical protein